MYSEGESRIPGRSYSNPSSLIRDAFGQVRNSITGDQFQTGNPELDALKRLILEGRVADETGSITVTPYGAVEVQPRSGGFGVRAQTGFDPSIELTYRTQGPQNFPTKSPEMLLDEALAELQRYR